MIAVALNYVGMIEEENIGSMFVKLFNDFKVIKLNPYDDIKAGQLQLCQPESYKELVQHLQMTWDSSETFLELRGSKAKLQKTVRQMLFFDEERKYEKVLLEGCDGINDFPWAIQIVLMQQTEMDGEQKLDWISKADLLIVNDSPGETSRDLINEMQMLRPGFPIFTAKELASGSRELQASLENLFAGYLESRQRIKEMLAEKYPEQSISCEQACRMAGKLSVNRFLLGNVCDEYGCSITHCGLGCF